MSDNTKQTEITTYSRVTLPFMAWLGGAFYVAHQPNCGFWDGVIWLYYVGRYIAAHYTLLSY